MNADTDALGVDTYLYPDWYIPEFVQPMHNGQPSCAWCEGYGEHHSYCGRADFVKHYRALCEELEARRKGAA